jgi:hypothetical protein
VGPYAGIFLTGEIKVFPPVFRGIDRVYPSMEGKYPFGPVPVIEKKVMEQGGPDKALHIGDFEIAAYAETQLCYVETVFIHRNPAMLNVSPGFGKRTVTENIRSDPFK